MKYKVIILILMAPLCISFTNILPDGKSVKLKSFNIEKDLLLAQFDCKTDVDDLHSVAAFATLVSVSDFSKVKYHAVSGTYGIQEGLYVPANSLFQLAFGDQWTDAHENFDKAVEKVKTLSKKILNNGGDIWIAEAGQSDFSAALVKAIQKDLKTLKTSLRIHIVQHSDWNEKVTSPEKLRFVKQNTDYIKIPDGNAVGNGTPGFRSPEFKDWKTRIKNPRLQEIWQLAVDLGNKFNGKENRYNNEAIASGGLDFSDISEICFILGMDDIKDTSEFFDLFAN